MESNKYSQEIRFSALLSIIIGCFVITGWVFNIEVFKSVFQGSNTMKFNSAFSFVLLGLSLYLFTSGKKVLSILPVIVVLIIGTLSLSQDVFQFTTGLDELFIKDWETIKAGKPFPGRMSPTTSFCFILMSVSLLTVKSGLAGLRVFANGVLHMVSLVSFIAILGYLYDVPSFYKLTFFVSMAVHTAFGFFILSISVSLLNPSAGLTGIFTGREIGKVMARRIFPMVGIAILVLGYIGIILNRNNILSVQFDIALFITSFFVLSLLIIANTVKHLNKIDSRRSKAEHSLVLLNRTLEQKVKERTAELEKSEEKFSKIFEMSPAGLIVSDLTRGVYLDVNESFLTMTGYSREQVIGKTTAEIGLVPQDEVEITRSLLKERGALKNSELTYITSSGERRTSLMSIEVVEIGEKRFGLSVLHDITHLKKIETELKVAKQVAEDSSIAKERFMANMSHEIRTPMNAIIGFTNLIENTKLDNEQSQYLSFIKNSGENLLVLVNDILDYSKIEAGMMQLEKVPFHIADLLYSIRVMFSEKAKEKNLDLLTEIDEKLPAILIGDPTRLTQILINLIGNAIKFTGQGSIHVGVHLLSNDGAIIQMGISVKDTGIGIPKDKQEDVFTRFMQASSETTRNYGGTGLGLSIVKRLVELQKGKISINSEEGKGTEFYITLPYMAGETESAESGNTIQPKIEIKEFDKKLTVLLAEDNIMNQLLAKKVLSQFGCEVDIAENGGIAVEMVNMKTYDLILMDIQMPIMDGYTASKAIRSHDKTVPIIAMTAHVMAGEREKCRSFGMTDYISKPFRIDALYSLILKYTQQDKVDS